MPGGSRDGPEGFGWFGHTDLGNGLEMSALFGHRVIKHLNRYPSVGQPALHDDTDFRWLLVGAHDLGRLSGFAFDVTGLGSWAR